MNSNPRLVDDGHLGGYAAGGDPATWCPHLWSWAIRRFQIESVLDVGCGEGWSTRFFADSGCDALGLEGSPQAIQNSAVPERIRQHDFCAGPFVPDRTLDMVWSCEFVEHVEHRYVENILETLQAARKAILLTHAFPGQAGHHHVNCQPNRYWIQKIEAIGFECSVALSCEARRISLQDYPSFNHFARSGLVFVRGPQARRGPAAGWSARWKELQIRWGFRLSPEYREQRRRKRLRKQAARAA